jgi:ferritin-like metal-binding protein YciE
MPIKSMQDLLVNELRDIYSAERIALRAYPRLRRLIQTDELRDAVDRHLEQTRGQVERVEQAFEKMDVRARGRTCHAMQGLTEEAQEHADDNVPPELMEVVLIADLQKIEHYEIAAYGAARSHAEALGLKDVARLLSQTLDEEKETDRLLNDLAVREVNRKALERET